MEVEVFNSQTENGDSGISSMNNSGLPPAHPSCNKNHPRNIHSASFGSGSSTCSSASSSSLSTGGGMAYSPAVRGHRDKFASSGRNLNTAAIVNGKNRKKSTSGSTGYAENTNGYSDNYIKENGGVPASGNTDNADNGSNQPQSLEDYSHSNSVKLPGGKTSCRANMNSNGDNAQAYGEPQKSTARRVSQNGSNADQMNETHGPNNYPHSYSPGSNSGKLCRKISQIAKLR